MNEISVLNGYLLKDKKAIRYYDNVEQMKQDRSLKAGMYVETKGYYTPNDGGKAKYQIELNNNLVNDNEMLHLLDNQLFARLITEKICPEMFGAYADNEHDDYQAIQDIINKGKDIYFNDKTYKINTPIVINTNISLFGNNATINFEGEDYAIKYINPISPNNWDLFEPFFIKDLNFVGDCDGAIFIDRFHYPKLDNIKIENNNDYGLKIKTSYWGSYSNIHIQNSNGGGILLCGTEITNDYTGSNQNIFNNISVLDYNKYGDFYGIKIIERSNQNNFNQITVQNSKDNNNNYSYGLYIKNAVNNSFYNFYAESQKIDVMIEKGDNGQISQATFYNPYFGIEKSTQCCLYCLDSNANIYNPYYYENELQSGYDKTMFISHHTSGHNSFIYLETDKPLFTNRNKLLQIYDGTNYTDYKNVSPSSGNYAVVFEKSPFNHNTLNLVFRSDINPLYVDNNKIFTESGVLKTSKWQMFGNQNGIYALQPTLCGNLSQIPTTPINGLKYFETNNNKTLTYYNGHWYYEDGTQYNS